MNYLKDLVDNSVKDYLKTKEEEKKICENKKVANSIKDNKSTNNLHKNEKNKRKIEDMESTDDENDTDLPRRRIVTIGQKNRRKRVMTKYQRELMKEREEEKFYADVFEEEYEDSLADFVVEDKSILIDDQMSSDDGLNVNRTSSFLRDNSSFFDDECEEIEEEAKDDCSDSEEEKMYMDARGVKNFYDDEDYDQQFTSDNEDEFSDGEDLFNNSSEFNAKVERKRNQFIFDDVSVDGNLETDDLDNEIESDESDLGSFIVDDDETTVIEDESEDEFTNNLDSSILFEKKKKKKRAYKLESSDEENLDMSSIIAADAKDKSKNRKIGNNTLANKSVLSNLENTSFHRSPEKKKDNIKDSKVKNSCKKEDEKLTNKLIENKVQLNNTIILDNNLSSKIITKTCLIDDSDDEEIIIKRTKSSKFKKTNLFDSSDEENDFELNQKTSNKIPVKLNDSTLLTDDNLDNSTIINEDSNFSYDNSSLDCLNNSKLMYKTVANSSSDESMLNFKKGNKIRNIIESDEDENIINQFSNIETENLSENDESIECVFSEDDQTNSKNFSDEEADLIDDSLGS